MSTMDVVPDPGPAIFSWVLSPGEEEDGVFTLKAPQQEQEQAEASADEDALGLEYWLGQGGGEQGDDGLDVDVQDEQDEVDVDSSKENAGPGGGKEQGAVDGEISLSLSSSSSLSKYLKTFECGLCSEKTHSSMHLKAHLYRHTNEKPLGGGAAAAVGCDYCGASFTSNEELLRHAERRHAYECTCTKHFASKRDLLEHCRTVHGVANGEGARAFGGGGASPLREKTAKLTSCPPQQGQKVLSSFTSPSMAKVIPSPSRKASGRNFNFAVPSQVSARLPGSCTLCSASEVFHSSPDFDLHVQECHPFKCPLCRKMVKLPTSIRRHFRKFHQGKRPFFCRKCTKVFTSEKHLVAHKTSRKCWRNRTDLASYDVNNSTASTPGFDLNGSEASDGAISSVSMIEEEDPFVSSVLYASGLLQPGETIEEIISADVYENGEDCVSNAGDVVMEEEMEEVFEAQDDFGFEISSHQREGEDEEAGGPDGGCQEDDEDGGGRCPFPCRLCRSGFETEEELLDHVYEEHLYTCPLCLKLYKGWGSIRKHCRTQHGKPATVCKVCVKVFMEPSERDAHNKEHHPEEEASASGGGRSPPAVGKSLPYQPVSAPARKVKCEDYIIADTYHCLYCSNTYTNGKSARKHSRKVHGLSQAICKYCPAVFRLPEMRDKHVGECHEGKQQENLVMSSYLVEKRPRSGISAGESLLRPPGAPSPSLLPSAGDSASCEMCQVSFSSSDQLRLHLDKLHPYKCPEPGCSKRYKMAKGWRNHYRTNHTNTKSLHVCHSCSSCFTSERAFNSHQDKGCAEEEPEAAGSVETDEAKEGAEAEKPVINPQKEYAEDDPIASGGSTSPEFRGFENCDAELKRSDSLRQLVTMVGEEDDDDLEVVS